jgi:hypothetical protein
MQQAAASAFDALVRIAQTHAPFAHAVDTRAMRDAFFSVHQV